MLVFVSFETFFILACIKVYGIVFDYTTKLIRSNCPGNRMCASNSTESGIICLHALKKMRRTRSTAFVSVRVFAHHMFACLETHATCKKNAKKKVTNTRVCVYACM